MSYVPILHLTIPAIWVSVILAFLATSLLQRFASGSKPKDWYWNAVTLYILAWKLSYILFNFDHFINMPLSLLYFNGGVPGHLLAVSLVIGYLFVARKKHIELTKQAVFSVLLFFIAYHVILAIFERQAVEALWHTVLLIVSIVSVRLMKSRDDVPHGLVIALLFMCELLISSAFGPLFTWQNATVVALAAFTLPLYIRHEQKGQFL
ncbi:hypothetical protein [Planococcus dechangensis]|uniref:Uncharacterized protein n=1 Tax=Planococcus dechangensis TaxID=1176255 RepID=A0ABV9M9C4_9BACL